MIRPGPALLALALLAPPAVAAATPACTATAEGSVDGFHAVAMLTGDKDWRAKWHAGPPGTLQGIAAAPVLGPGQEADLLVFFAHALTDREGGAHVDCELRVTRPDGKVSHLAPLRCFDAAPRGPDGELQRTALRAHITVTPQKLRGVWRASFLLTDVLAHRTVPLDFCYEIVPGDRGQG